ncbi:MAG: Cytoplasmic membrane protein FsxA, partial [uncultured Nocardioides sp.]
GEAGQDQPQGCHRRHPQQAEECRAASWRNDPRCGGPGGPADHRRRGVQAGEGLDGPAQLREHGPRRHRRPGHRRVPGDRDQEGRGHPGSRGARHPARLRRLPAGLRPALQRLGVDRPQVLQRLRPARARQPRAQPRARLHHPLVRRDRRRGRGDDGRAARHRLEVRWRVQPAQQVQGRALDQRGRRPVPRRPAPRADALVRRRRGRDRPGQAGRRDAVLQRAERRGGRVVHARVPLPRLPGADGPL